MKGQQLFDYQKIDINTAKLKTHGQTFEIVVDPDLAIDLKNKKEVDIREILKAQQIFVDANKGLLASEVELKKVFGTNDPLEIATKILKEGDIQLSSEYRDKVRADKKKRIIDMIHRNGIDPKTKLPHPATRIENAFSQGKIHIDEFKKPEDQVEDIIKKLMPILPIRFARKEIQLIIPSQYASRLYGRVQHFGHIKKEEWMNDGSWFAVVEIPAGLQNEFFDELNKETHGNIDTKILSEK
ncbi:MAG: ribosome assembly factor SBDS [Nanoarchaeota archaeon]|nr:ribosome assembly factor SBDS [Nanoarchaeota archaeon]MBU1269642.1 ribosome assembly factor SBDS [Nanoarchaeota archaeon]MBU1605075.1 ribosome assembly factor SBDS [Nanoarchaeota archaeon]MBU2442955.1 ribosome assembly factor SBDS [Nanoarchaeota archaeon]